MALTYNLWNSSPGCRRSVTNKSQGLLKTRRVLLPLLVLSVHVCQLRPWHRESVTPACLHQPDETSFTLLWMNTHSDSTLSCLSAVLLLSGRTIARWHLERLTWRQRDPQEQRYMSNSQTQTPVNNTRAQAGRWDHTVQNRKSQTAGVIMLIRGSGSIELIKWCPYMTWCQSLLSLRYHRNCLLMYWLTCVSVVVLISKLWDLNCIPMSSRFSPNCFSSTKQWHEKQEK